VHSRLLVDSSEGQTPRLFGVRSDGEQVDVAGMSEGSRDQYAYTPFDVLKGIMKTEGHTTTSNGRNISIEKFQVLSIAVSAMRNKVIDATINLLTHTNIKIAVLAAKFLHECLRYPMGMLNMQISTESHGVWTVEFVST
jgi:hypothetical protein